MCDACRMALAGSLIANVEKRRLLRVGDGLLPSPLLELPSVLMCSGS